jgi:hypothetical protein
VLCVVSMVISREFSWLFLSFSMVYWMFGCMESNSLSVSSMSVWSSL